MIYGLIVHFVLFFPTGGPSFATKFVFIVCNSLAMFVFLDSLSVTCLSGFEGMTSVMLLIQLQGFNLAFVGIGKCWVELGKPL